MELVRKVPLDTLDLLVSSSEFVVIVFFFKLEDVEKTFHSLLDFIQKSIIVLVFKFLI